LILAQEAIAVKLLIDCPNDLLPYWGQI